MTTNQQQTERKEAFRMHGIVDPGWRPPTLSERSRTISTDSSGSIDSPTKERRFSFTEKLLGVSLGGRRASASEEMKSIPESKEQMKITQNEGFQKFMKRERKILGDGEWQ